MGSGVDSLPLSLRSNNRVSISPSVTLLLGPRIGIESQRLVQNTNPRRLGERPGVQRSPCPGCRQIGTEAAFLQPLLPRPARIWLGNLCRFGVKRTDPKLTRVLTHVQRGAVALLAYLWILGDALESLASLLLSFSSTHVGKSIDNYYPLMKGLGRRDQAVHAYQDLVSDEQKVTHAKHQPQLSS